MAFRKKYLLRAISALLLIGGLILGSRESSAVIEGGNLDPNSELARGTVLIMTDEVSLCTGTLLGKDTVLTAAHCVQNFQTGHDYPFIRIVIHPSLNFPLLPYFLGGSSGKIKSLKVHEQFAITSDGARNDLALIRLQDPQEISEGLSLPETDLDPHGSLTEIAGYGLHSARNPFAVYVLKEASLRGWPLVLDDVDPIETQILLIGGHQPCSGDSGGPLIQEREGKLVLVGVTTSVMSSKELGKCSFGGRAISVYNHLPWIRGAAAELGASLK
jgi:Trypsin